MYFGVFGHFLTCKKSLKPYKNNTFKGFCIAKNDKKHQNTL